MNTANVIVIQICDSIYSIKMTVEAVPSYQDNDIYCFCKEKKYT